jgi:hypothetical protein
VAGRVQCVCVTVTTLLLAETKESEWIPHQNGKSNKMEEPDRVRSKKILDKKSKKTPQNTPNYYPFLIKGTKIKREEKKKILTPEST